ncbi:glycoside hydrolase family 35 protein [Glonium stellatum]|uniref:Beta-galactosidase n=1 Tax=Glonium stellatum TaxID=574774 RepID=A0A8E2JN18_9PEZI|nr:glycoside hydrolase family 35 protein [Glonium stellatum]
MKLSFKFLTSLVLSCLAIESAARAVGGKPKRWIQPYKRAPLQDIVTWDEDSLFVRGERIFWYSGEFHPFRLPVASLYLDVFQKIKAMGYNGVSFYVDWALLEGKPGEFSADGVFALEPFFDAASKAGIYLLARPGPYINAEASGGGFPGWLQRVNATLRTADQAYLDATNLYTKSIGEIIAKAQITNGGPVILLQPENEYSGATSNVKFPDPVYFGYVEEQYRNASIVVPFISNDAWTAGYFTPGSESAVDIYGHDGYPLGFDCAHPYTWPSGALPTGWRTTHLEQSPSTPYAIVEFQGGSFDPWGGLGFEQCSVLLNNEFERVFYKNDYSFGVTIFNIYMTYGGTNWGNLGHPGGYTSYDYGAVITEERLVTREKYSEQKLEANFFKVTPAYLTADRGNTSTTSWTTTTDLTVTPAFSNSTKFYFLRHTAYNSLDSTSYKLHVQTASFGNLTVPQLNGSLTLNGRDSKIHVSDYDIGGVNIVYSTAEVFTWKKYSSKTVLIVYGGPGEQHEIAIQASSATIVEGSGPTIVQKNGYSIVNWGVTPNRKIIKVNSNVYIYLLDRNSAYNYWVVDLAPYSSADSVVVKAGYLLRSAELKGSTLALTGDLNATTPIEVIGGTPNSLSKLTFNGISLPFKAGDFGVYTATANYEEPKLTLPDLSTLTWKYLDSLPEVQPSYSDAAWTSADLKTTYNTLRSLTTPTSLYGSDYGYNTGTLLFRGHFTATGTETSLFLWTQGGSAFGMTAWLNSDFIGSWDGIDAASNADTTFTLPNLTAGKSYVFTIVIDNMGLDEDWTVGSETMKNPRGILNYTLSGRPQSAITWKLTGNLGGESYADHSRGPLNEGGMYAERQGYHLPSAPTDSWDDSAGPTAGIPAAGIGFFATSFDLDMPKGYDIPLSFVFTNSSSSTAGNSSLASAYRVQLFVNGWQFGKYVHNVGPQTKFPVPEGIFDYHGSNYVAVTLWALEKGGAKVEGLKLAADAVVQTGFGEVETVQGQKWVKRKGAY